METATTEPWELVEALDDGRGFVDRSEDRAVVVRGADARGWLGDLVTADIASLVPGSSRRSLLLTPTGRIRADMWIAQIDDDAFLVLAGERSARTRRRPAARRTSSRRPSGWSPRPTSVPSSCSRASGGDRHALGGTTARSFGDGRPGVDRSASTSEPSRSGASAGETLGWGSTSKQAPCPPKPGWSDSIDVTKGCFLGQESVAKVRNLGHPPTVLRHLRCDTRVIAGASVSAADGAPAGRRWDESRARRPLGRAGPCSLARVEFRAAGASLPPRDGSPLSPVRD